MDQVSASALCAAPMLWRRCDEKTARERRSGAHVDVAERALRVAYCLLCVYVRPLRARVFLSDRCSLPHASGLCSSRENRRRLVVAPPGLFVAIFSIKRKKITLTGGSLGSWVDEERS